MQIDCTGSDLFDNKAFLAWLDSLKTQIQGRNAGAARWRMYAYQHGIAQYVALDMFTDNPDLDIAMTICLTPGAADISEMVDGQLDMSLPSVIELLQFSACLMGSEGGKLQVAAWDAKPT